MQLQVIFAFIKPDPNTNVQRTFNMGERYDVAGDQFMLPKLCGPCGNKVMRMAPFWNIIVDGKQLTVDADFLGPTDATVNAVVVESMDKRLNSLGQVPGPYDDRPQPQDNSEANWQQFNDLAIFDLRTDADKARDANKGLPL